MLCGGTISIRTVKLAEDIQIGDRFEMPYCGTLVTTVCRREFPDGGINVECVDGFGHRRIMMTHRGRIETLAESAA